MSGNFSGPQVELPLNHLSRLHRRSISDDILPFRFDRTYSRTIIGGMGGSGIAGAMVSDISCQLCSKPVYILRVNKIPSWADEDTLVIAVSYSGDTRETLDLYKDSMERGCGIVAITTGGKLGKLAEENGTPRISIKGGHMPRSDIGFVVLAIAAILDMNDPGFDITKRFTTVFDRALEYAEKLSHKDDPDNPAMQVARFLKDKIPFFYSHESIQSVTSRWKAQFNENSKKVAASGCFPEFNHNELEGWCHNTDGCIVPVLLRTGERGEASRYLEKCMKVMEEHGNPFYVVDILGKTTVERVTYGIILGDYVSLYVAELNGVDPSPVDAITEYKKLLNS